MSSRPSKALAPESSDRHMLLIGASAEFPTLADRTEFLEAVCADDKALLQGLLDTIARQDENANATTSAAEQLPVLPSGELIAGRFEIVRPLGAGGMALVYEAFDR